MSFIKFTRHSELLLSILGFSSLIALLLLGNMWAFSKGGHDFGVFYTTWKLVLTGQPMGIYKIPTDRFLYIPGFAWLLSPLALLPQSVALFVWNFLKSVLLVVFFWRESDRSLKKMGLLCLSCLIFLRPLLIEFQYGQVNLIVILLAAWALQDLAAGFSKLKPILWFLFGVVSISKLLTLPLILLLIFDIYLTPRNISIKRLFCVFLGFLFIITLPLISISFDSLLHLFFEWRGAVAERGIPMDSHNQSFVAFLYHFTRGIPTHINLLFKDIQYGWYILKTDQAVHRLAYTWALGWLSWVFILMAKSFRQDQTKRFGCFLLVLSTLIIPLHLVWKPYFIFALPWVTYLIQHFFINRKTLLGILLFFAGLNFTSFDFLGLNMAARLEAGAVLLWSYLVLVLLTSNGINDKMSITIQNTVINPKS